ncbi:CsbD family protein [Methylobacterium radiodurans]|uniref:CsbD family protein n=1 Tax=Methylobacterium radiodurans TaxID=2202828 RepID=A0A2U8VST3_9HYPH|nr:CsbD family protein [Methylobacterium radiodurans]AWN36501.1 CsbD family protein [Methylobacterium radiodurans]
MSSTTDKIKGAINEAIGNAKQGIGNATDNDRLKTEGKAQELKGTTQRGVGEAKDTVKSAVGGKL